MKVGQVFISAIFAESFREPLEIFEEPLKCHTCWATSLELCQQNGEIRECNRNQESCMLTERRQDGKVISVNMRCKQHQACDANMKGNYHDCDPAKDKGSSVCRQCCDGEAGNCNVELYEEILNEPRSLQALKYETSQVFNHVLPPTGVPYVVRWTKLWNGEEVAENDSRAIEQKRLEGLGQTGPQ